MYLNTETDKIISQFDKINTPSFKKYLPTSDLDLQWGLTINDLGHTKIVRNTSYPTQGHPGEYMFSWETGFAPLQYFLLMKVEKAKDLLTNTDLRAKQIAYSLGFKSDHYFSRIFKLKTGLTPLNFRIENHVLNP